MAFTPFQFSFTNPDPYTLEGRKKRAFGNIDFPEDENQEEQFSAEPQHPQQTIMDAYKEVLNRQEGPAMTGYRKFLEQGYPNEADYKPGKLTRLGAILSGAAAGFQNPASGYVTARGILRQPYEQAVERYKNEGSRLAAGAQLEENTYNKRMGVLNTLSQIQNRQEDNERANQQLDLARDRARRAGLKVIEDKADGHYYSIDPTTGERTDLGKYSLTPQETTQNKVKEYETMSPFVVGRNREISKDRSKFALENFAIEESTREANRVKADERATNRAIKVEDVRQKNRLALGATRDEQIRNRIKFRTDEQIRRDIEKKTGTAASGSAINRIRENMFSVESLYHTDPARYDKVWDNDNQELKFPPAIGTPEYQDYVQIYNALYKGTGHQLSGKDPRIVGEK